MGRYYHYALIHIPGKNYGQMQWQDDCGLVLLDAGQQTGTSVVLCSSLCLTSLICTNKMNDKFYHRKSMEADDEKLIIND